MDMKLSRNHAKAQRLLPEPVIIDSDAALRRLVETLRTETAIAVDTESNSLYVYHERVCLIQISTRTTDYIIDPLTLDDCSPLAAVFEDERIEKVFHAAEYDVMCIKRDFGFAIHHVFDTMVAARICGYKNIGLATLLREIVGVEADKSHQRDDWGRRPLPEEGLLYAQMDTHYLLRIRDHFAAELEKNGRWLEAREIFDDLSHIPAADHQFDPDGFWRISIPNNLRDRQVAILRELYLLRDELARQRNLPAFKIMSDRVMISLASAAPKSYTELERTDGVTRPLIKHHGRLLLEAIKRGQAAPTPAQPQPDPPTDPITVERYTALREWRKARASQRGVESDVILPRDALWTIALRAPRSLDDMRDIRGLGPWRQAEYGRELLEVIRRFERRKG